jgi:serine/threonine protein kinase
VSPEIDWDRVEEVFAGALACDPAERAAYLDAACRGDACVRAEAESLLAAYPRSQRDDFRVAISPDDRKSLLDALDATSLIGKMLDRFLVESYLGEGGMGRVYKARDTRLGREVAIKVSAREFGDRFEREAQAIAALNHSNICTLHDVGPNYLVMELVEGPTLAERIAKGAIPLEESLAIAAQIADGMEAAHEKGVVHRDLKPANVKITPSGTVKVLDFGLAKAVPASTGISQNPATSQGGIILGTAAYMSPEQASGQTVDRRTDIWAFGATLYEMLTGKAAFEGETTGEVLNQIAHNSPDLELLPGSVRPVIERCLSKDPAKRWRSIADVRLALELPTPPIPQPRRRLSVWAIAAAAATASLITWLVLRPAANHPNNSMMRVSVDLGPDAVAGDRVTAAISPDGTRLVFPSRAPDGKLRLSLRRLNQSGSVALEGTEEGFDPFFSPDGNWVGFFAKGMMKKVSAEGGPAVTLCEAPAPRGASWGEDGNIVAALRGRGGLSVVPSAGGTPRPLTQPSGGDLTHRWPQVLPGGTAVLYTAHTKSAQYDDARIDVLTTR